MESLLLKLCRGGYVCESKMDEMMGVLSSEIMLPWCGVDELKCENIKKNSGWIHISQLSKKKSAIVIEKRLIVFSNPTIYSKPLVLLEQGKMCLIKKCKGD